MFFATNLQNFMLPRASVAEHVRIEILLTDFWITLYINGQIFSHKR